VNLTPTGVSVLLVYGAKIFPPKPHKGYPGIRPIVHANGDVVLYPIGYGSQHAAAVAVGEAADVCHAAGLEVLDGPEPRTRIVRRRSATLQP
jgi:hypothetical protein